MLNQFIEILERHLAILSLLFFTIGIFWADQSTSFAYSVYHLMENFIESYSYIAPIAIYLILTPTVIKLFHSEIRGKSFARYTIKWFIIARMLACLFAVIFTAIAFHLPLYAQGTGLTQAITESFQSLGWMLMHSVYFYAVYAAIVTVVIAWRYDRLAQFLEQGVEIVEEYLGKVILPFIPLLMMGVGAYVTVLPEILEQNVGADFKNIQLDSIDIFGVSIQIASSLGMILLYVLASLLTGLACGIWHIGLLILAKKHMPEFSIRKYFSIYWVKVYPLLWATSSEALAMPFNLYMVKKFCPTIPDEVRQFVVGTGSFLNINGSMINVFIMTGLITTMLGINISVVQLLLSVPVVFLLGYGVPGIPGELLIFAGPMALCMGISPELTPIFLSLYVGLQIGLPDSFRTASNSTDACLCTVILNRKY